ncbi:MAG: hypothetical protein KF729_26850 [Sandaracinaceae bacterium]|nr:hypothetical protein [Sandaracinaceae bacterium]
MLVLMAPLLAGGRRGTCDGPRGFYVDVREPLPVGDRTARYFVEMPTWADEDLSGSARLITPWAPLVGGPGVGARVDRIRWQGDSYSQALIFPAEGDAAGTIRERGWTRSSDDGAIDLGLAGRFSSVRSVDLGSCSATQSYIDGAGGGFAEQLDAGLLEALRQPIADSAPDACAITCAGHLEPITYLICLSNCVAVGARVGRNRPSEFWPTFGSQAPSGVPEVTETEGYPTDDSLCYSADFYAGVAHTFTDSAPFTVCFQIGVRRSFVPFLEREALRRPDDRARAPFEFERSRVTVRLTRVVVGTFRSGQLPTITPAQLEAALRDPVGGLAPSLEARITEALWAPALCPALTNAANRAACRLATGTNDVRMRDGAPQFLAHPDRFEVFPDRLEIVLTRDYWDRPEEAPPPSLQTDRQVDIFRVGMLCDRARMIPASIDHPTARLVIP